MRNDSAKLWFQGFGSLGAMEIYLLQTLYGDTLLVVHERA